MAPNSQKNADVTPSGIWH